jgi:hypothetical protein
MQKSNGRRCQTKSRHSREINGKATPLATARDSKKCTLPLGQKTQKLIACGGGGGIPEQSWRRRHLLARRVGLFVLTPMAKGCVRGKRDLLRRWEEDLGTVTKEKWERKNMEKSCALKKSLKIDIL